MTGWRWLPGRLDESRLPRRRRREGAVPTESEIVLERPRRPLSRSRKRRRREGGKFGRIQSALQATPEDPSTHPTRSSHRVGGRGREAWPSVSPRARLSTRSRTDADDALRESPEPERRGASIARSPPGP